MSAFIRFTTPGNPSITDWPTRKWPMFSSITSGDGGDRGHVGVGQAMPGMALEPQADQRRRPGTQPLELARPALGIGAGVQFDDGGAEPGRRLELGRVGVEEQRDPDAAPSRSAATCGPSAAACPAASRPPSVVTSWRRSGTRQHAAGRSRSAIATISSVAAISMLSRISGDSGDPLEVRVADVPAVLAQMDGDAVRAGADRHQRRRERVGMRAAARVADRRHVVDVHAEANAHAGPPIRSAIRSAAIRLVGSARFCPAMSKAVPWSGEVRTIGRPSVMFTPLAMSSVFSGISAWS